MLHWPTMYFQEAYVRLLQSDLRDPSEAKLKSYLFTVATNLLRDHWRRAKKSVRWEDSAPGEPCADAGDNALDARIGVEKAFGKLSPQQRSLLWLAYVEMYSHEEIADMLNLRQKSVRVLLFRARKGKLVEVLHSMGIRKEGVL